MNNFNKVISLLTVFLITSCSQTINRSVRNQTPQQANGITMNSPATNWINSGNQNNFPLSGTCVCNDSISLDANGNVVTQSITNNIVTLSIAGQNIGTAQCINGNWSGTYNLSGISDSLAHLISASMPCGTSSLGPAQDTLGKDTVAPTVTVVVPAQIDPSQPYPLTGTCNDNGDSIELTSATMTPSPVTTTCNSGSYTAGPVQFTGAANSTVIVNATITDPAGNSASSSGQGVMSDTPASISINNLPNPINSTNTNSTALSGSCSCPAGDTNQSDNFVSVSLNGSVLASNIPCSSNGMWNYNPNFNSINDGNLNFIANLNCGSDTAGPVNQTTIKDTTLPTVTITLPAEVMANTNYSLSGSCSESNQNVTLTSTYMNPPTIVAPCTNGTYSTPNNITFNAPGSTNISVNASIQDVAGNTGTDTANTVMDDVDPAIVINPIGQVNANSLPTTNIEGTCECPVSATPQTINVYINNTLLGNTTCSSNGTWSIPLGNNYANLNSQTMPVSAQLNCGNEPPSNDTDQLVIDTKVPTVDLNLPSQVNNTNIYSLTGTCSESGAVVTLTNTNGGMSPSSITAVCNGTNFTTTNSVTFNAANGQTINVAATIADSTGNIGQDPNNQTMMNNTPGHLTITGPNYVNLNNQGATPLEGTCQCPGGSTAGSNPNVSLAVNGNSNLISPNQVTCSVWQAGRNYIINNSVPQGNALITASLNCGNSTVGPETLSVIKDTIAPTIDVLPYNNVANSSINSGQSYPIRIRCQSVGDNINLNISLFGSMNSSQNAATTCNQNNSTYTTANAGIVGNDGDNWKVTATITDAAGNTASDFISHPIRKINFSYTHPNHQGDTRCTGEINTVSNAQAQCMNFFNTVCNAPNKAFYTFNQDNISDPYNARLWIVPGNHRTRSIIINVPLTGRYKIHHLAHRGENGDYCQASENYHWSIGNVAGADVMDRGCRNSEKNNDVFDQHLNVSTLNLQAGNQPFSLRMDNAWINNSVAAAALCLEYIDSI